MLGRRGTLQELSVLLIIPPGRPLTRTDALNEPLCLLLLKFSRCLCTAHLCYVALNIAQHGGELGKRNQANAQKGIS